MTATVDVHPEPGASGGDAVAGWLAETLAALGDVAAGTSGVGDAARVDRIALLERVKAAAFAAQAAEIVAFARSQVAQQQTDQVDYRRLGHGVGEQVGLATHTGGVPELIATTTPTGHTYLSRAPNPPRRMS